LTIINLSKPKNYSLEKKLLHNNILHKNIKFYTDNILLMKANHTY